MTRSNVKPEPFFCSEPSDAARDRLLLLSTHFPPGQAAGARRWEKLAHFAAKRGFALDVVTLDPRDLEARDPTRLDGLPAGVRIFGVPARKHIASRPIDALSKLVRRFRRAPRLETALPAQSAAAPTASSPSTVPAPGTVPAALAGEDWPRREDILRAGYGPSTWRPALNALLEIADDAAWADAAAELAGRFFDPRLHRAIVSCGPPHMIHAAARRLARRVGVPLVVDLRDAWSERERLHASFASALWFRLAGLFEARAFEQASLVVMNTPAAAMLMARVYPALASKILSVTNGYDEEEGLVADFGPAFVIAYAGSIYLDRSPRNLFRATRQVARELELGANDLRIELMGNFEVELIRGMAREEGVEDRLVLHPPGNLRDVAKLLSRAPMLVNLPQDSDLAIPSKIFEYIVRPAWVLALAVQASATGQVLAESRADVVAPEDVAGIARVIRARYLAYRAGERPKPIADDPRLGRAYQAGILFDAIERCVRRAGQGTGIENP
ncbi:MAG: hypothetical protein IPK00_02310 [Deltaproteobacteria bacterium]|nr:hypothetical protein [Deltaproteobacteria bacterium]